MATAVVLFPVLKKNLELRKICFFLGGGGKISKVYLLGNIWFSYIETGMKDQLQLTVLTQLLHLTPVTEGEDTSTHFFVILIVASQGVGRH